MKARKTMRVTWYSKGFKPSAFSSIKNYVLGQKHNYDYLTASLWIRCLQIIPYLEKLNIECCTNDGSSLDTDIGIIMRWQDADAYELINKLRNHDVKTILDVCVNYFDGPVEFTEGYGVSKVQVEEMRRIAPVADVITCSSTYIQERASELNPRAICIPDSINLEHFRLRKKSGDYSGRIPRAIWAGHSVKASEVVDLYPILRQRGIPLTVISNQKISIPGPHRFIPWSYQSFPENIMGGDFCISPRRTDNSYDLGHSHFKIGVFMAQGVPALCSALPSYVELIGKTNGGMICQSHLDWVKVLDKILEDRNSLWRWSTGAYEGMRCYSTANIAMSYMEVFETLVSGSGINSH